MPGRIDNEDIVKTFEAANKAIADLCGHILDLNSRMCELEKKVRSLEKPIIPKLNPWDKIGGKDEHPNKHPFRFRMSASDHLREKLRQEDCYYV